MRVTDGTRTRDVQDHNLALYQLSYGHRFDAKWVFTAFAGPVNTPRVTGA